MPSRTDNDIKNRWNSIIRKQQHPGGREWEPEENEARAQILGSASRTQAGRRATAPGRTEGSAPGERKRKDTGPNADPDELEDAADCAPEDSPSQGRKLFLSPGTPPSPAAAPARAMTPVSSPPQIAHQGGEPSREAEHLEAPVCKLFGAEEITASSFDVDPFLGVAASSVSQLCSPVCPFIFNSLRPPAARTLLCLPPVNLTTSVVISQMMNEGRVASRLSNTPQLLTTPQQSTPQLHWFDHDLVNSLSPILTPSLRHPRSQ